MLHESGTTRNFVFFSSFWLPLRHFVLPSLIVDNLFWFPFSTRSSNENGVSICQTYPLTLAPCSCHAMTIEFYPKFFNLKRKKNPIEEIKREILNDDAMWEPKRRSTRNAGCQWHRHVCRWTLIYFKVNNHDRYPCNSRTLSAPPLSLASVVPSRLSAQSLYLVIPSLTFLVLNGRQ